jgi:TnpA family transposase
MSMPKIENCNINKYSAASALLQSIALEETAISHILNAEGEKLQKAISLCNTNQKDLIEINKSVEDMVEKITSLEIILKAKLDIISPLLDNNVQKPPKTECGQPG